MRNKNKVITEISGSAKAYSEKLTDYLNAIPGLLQLHDKADFLFRLGIGFEKIRSVLNDLDKDVLAKLHEMADTVPQKKPKKPKEEKQEVDYTPLVEEIVFYLNLHAAKHFRSDTASTVKLITQKLKKGYTTLDFKTVIDVKVAEWIDTDMEKFLRPETLFSNKFDSYLNQPKNNGKTTGKDKRSTSKDRSRYEAGEDKDYSKGFDVE